MMHYLKDTHTLPYRSYIDGLRGVAVAAVVLYHAKLLSVTGGFVGVDVFFVISGFLIASIIIRDLKAGVFSLIGFWERRMRRILPALFVVICCSIIAAYFLMLYPPEYQYFGTTVAAQSVFGSNVLFMLSDNYFDQTAQYSPLLHTWSLSVEEQFYILFPLLVLLCAWLGRKSLLFASVLFCTVASLTLSVWLVNVTPHATEAFYLIFTRAWELGAGILLALSAIKIRSTLWAEVLSVGGIAAIAAAAFLCNDATPFPGIAALLPVLGTAAIIAAGESHSTKIGKLLSYSPLVWIGLISYSLYLWHWPIFVFAKLAAGSPLSKTAMAGLIVLATALAWLSYRFIETPFRKKIFIPQRKHLFLAGSAALAFLGISGFLISRPTPELTGRIPPAAQSVLLASAPLHTWGAECTRVPGDASSYTNCFIGAQTKSPQKQFVTWGDSHAEGLAPLLNTLGETYGLRGAVFDDGSCIPIVGVHQIPPTIGCEEENANAIRYIQENNIRNIILIARWSYYLTGGPSGVQAAFITDSDKSSTSSAETEKVFERNLVPMVQSWSKEGRNVTIVEQTPEQLDFSVRDAFYLAVHTGKEIQFQGVPTAVHEAYQAFPNSVIETLGKLPGVRVIDPTSVLCTQGGICNLAKDGVLLYRDEDHLSTAGAMSLEPLFAPLFKSFMI